MPSTERLHTHRKAPRGFFRSFLLFLGVSLLGYMVFRAGPGTVWKQVQAVGWGLALIIIMVGFSQLIKTCAWRQTFACDISALSWSRSLGAQLVSDAVGQLGFAGKLFGEGSTLFYAWFCRATKQLEYRLPRLMEDCMLSQR